MPMPLDLEQHFAHLRERDFPALQDNSVYLDSAATSLKPLPVIEALSHFYLYEYGTVHRAIYTRASHATELYNQVRLQLAQFMGGSGDPSEIVFTRGTTDGINIIADSIARSGILTEKKTILISEMEHHSNIVPWQMAAERTGATLEIIPLVDGILDLAFLEKIVREKDVAVLSLTHCSNILGTINPVEEIAKIARRYRGDEILIVIDGAQSAPHMKMNIEALNVDLYLFSSHKMSGPTGVGALWGKKKVLEKLPPSRGGGDMIDRVTFEKTSYAPPPLRFEPGTPPIGEVIGFGRAILYLQEECSGLEAIATWEHELLAYLQNGLTEISPRIELVGNILAPRGPLQSFQIHGAHPLDIATLLDLEQIAVRSGHLCGQPLLAKLNCTSILRASLAYYNTKNDIDRFLEALQKIIKNIL